MLSIQGLSKSYGERPVLERVSLDVDAQAFCTIVGASGCGKSTFLRILLGQEQASGGTILLDDVPLLQEPGPDRGVVFQKYSVFPHLTVHQNLMLAADFEGSAFLGRVFGRARQEALERADALLERVGLARAADLYPAQLSGGMQQRLAIAQTLMKRPRMLLLDEPFGALDPGVRLEMHALLIDIWREHAMTIFMVTHDLPEAFKLGTRLLVFDKVRDDPQFPDAYGATITYDLAIGVPGAEAADAGSAGSEPAGDDTSSTGSTKENDNAATA